MILYVNGSAIRVANNNKMDVSGWYALEFAGAFLAILFWVSIQIYTSHGIGNRRGYTKE